MDNMVINENKIKLVTGVEDVLFTTLHQHRPMLVSGVG